MCEIVSVGKLGSKQYSGQTSGVLGRINSGRPRAIFPRKISKTTQKQLLSRKISERKVIRASLSVEGNKVGKKNSIIFEHEANSSTGILLIHLSVLIFNKNKDDCKTPRLTCM